MRPSRLLFALLSSLCCIASPVDAQGAAAIGLGGIDQLFGRVQAINIYYGGSLGRSTDGSASRTQLPWSKDYGLEFLLHVGDFGPFSAAHRRRAVALRQRQLSAMDSLRGVRTERRRTSRTMSRSARDSLDRKFAADSASIVAEQEGAFRPTSITVKKHLSISGTDTVLVGVDSEFVGTREPPPPVERLFDLDLGIGYGQMDGLRYGGTYELHGSVRELPSISAYVTAKLYDRIGVYGGVRTGVITLQDAQLFVTNTDGTAMFTLSSTSFEFGAPLGIDLQPVHGIHLTLEAAYMRRIFNSISFEPTTGFPQDYPRSLDLSGWSWSAGIQFPLP
ncbi:MAG: hypothetical protein ABIP93_15010 [Gemmatimonadaceae bacterium]